MKDGAVKLNLVKQEMRFTHGIAIVKAYAIFTFEKENIQTYIWF